MSMSCSSVMRVVDLALHFQTFSLLLFTMFFFFFFVLYNLLTSNDYFTAVSLHTLVALKVHPGPSA